MAIAVQEWPGRVSVEKFILGLKKFIRVFDFFSYGLAKGLIPILFRMVMLYLFVWYLVEFFVELHPKHWFLADSLIVVAIAAAVLTIIRIYPGFDSNKEVTV